MADRLRELLIGDWWRYTISLLGTVMLAVGLAVIFLDGQLTDEELLQGAGLIIFCLALIAVGARIALVVREYNQLGLILGWTSLGVLVLAGLGLWGSIVVRTVETPFEAALLFLSVLAAGALFGAVVGYYDVQVRELVTQASREQARREFLDEQQDTLSSLNGILRHQILNDLSAISGRAELLESGKIESDRATASITDHCEHMEQTIDRVETLVDILTHGDDPDEYDLAVALQDGYNVAVDMHPDLSVEGIDSVTATVWADDLLHLAVAELFENSAIHGDGNVHVSVTTAGNRVSLRITDGGDSVAVSEPLKPNTRGPDSDCDGLGLYFVSLIIDRYDGSIELVDDSDSASTTFLIELPSAGESS